METILDDIQNFKEKLSPEAQKMWSEELEVKLEAEILVYELRILQ